MIEKMPGGYEDKFSNLRTAYGFMATHPGKKLLFMGQEFAQMKEFNESEELDWSLFEFDAHNSIISFERRGSKPEDTLLIICNFTPIDAKSYKLAVPTAGKWKEIFSSDLAKFGGEGHNNKTVKQSKVGKVDGRENYISITVPALSISVFKKK